MNLAHTCHDIRPLLCGRCWSRAQKGGAQNNVPELWGHICEDSLLPDFALPEEVGGSPRVWCSTPLHVGFERPPSEHSWNRCPGPPPRDGKPELESWSIPTHTLFTHASEFHRKPVRSSSETGLPRTSHTIGKPSKAARHKRLGPTLYMKSSWKVQLPSTARSSKYCL